MFHGENVLVNEKTTIIVVPSYVPLSPSSCENGVSYLVHLVLETCVMIQCSRTGSVLYQKLVQLVHLIGQFKRRDWTVSELEVTKVVLAA